MEQKANGTWAERESGVATATIINGLTEVEIDAALCCVMVQQTTNDKNRS